MPKGVYDHKKRRAIPWDLDQYEARVETLKTTLARIEALPPALGRQWRQGMLDYYSRILAEMESYRHAVIQANRKPK